ncbi:MAG TPA: hypothetical protein VNY78_03430 [Edaphobacter sp.]|nr:hypothetical protein [Edaphobacter sp.]
MTALLRKFLCFILALAFFTVQTVRAQQTTPAAHVPSQIQQAQTIFLTNSGSDPNFPIDATTAYNDIYAALQTRGRYKLVNSPDQADLVFQLKGIAPITEVSGNRGGGVYSVTSPAFQLTILDPKSNIALWTITSPVNVTGKDQVLARWVSISETNLVSRVKVVADQSLSPDETADLTTVPKYHSARTALIVTGAFVGAAVAGGLIMYHLHENALANMKASQDAFCEANNIPLSQCAGG